MNSKINTKCKITQDYHKKKRTIFLYRCIFVSLGSFFIWATAQLFFHGHHLHIPVFKDSLLSFSTFLDLLALILGLTSLWVGCSLRTAEELLRDYYKTHKQLVEHYSVQAERSLKSLNSIALSAKENLDGCHCYEKKIEILILANAQLEQIANEVKNLNTHPLRGGII